MTPIDPAYVEWCEARIKELEQQRDELLAALELCLSWIDNWSPSFTDDPEWEQDRESIDAAINKVQK